ncbi:hypothetical protein ACQ4PT_069493 [Festuca glaucescens]
MSNNGRGDDHARGNGPGRGRGGAYHGAGRGGGYNATGRGGGYGGAANGGPFNGSSSANGAGFNGPHASNGDRGGGGYNARFFGGASNRQSNFVAGESSGSADARDGQGQAFQTEFGADFGHFNRGSNYSNYNRGGGNFQYRPRNFGSNNFNATNRNYGGGRSNYNQFRNVGGGNNGSVNQMGSNLAGISPDLLKEAMQGVVAALAAAAQKGGGEGLSHAVQAERVLDGVQTAGHTGATVSQQNQLVTPGMQQTQPMQMDTVAVQKSDAPNPAKKAKKADKNPCFRWGTYKPKVDNMKLVKVTVEGDPMTIPEIADCLRRIVPVENFQWEIYNFQNNVFRVKFPNKVEAHRMKAFHTYPVPDRASDLIFDDWSALEDPLYMLPEVWLRVRGIPADVRTDFLSLWAVGTLFGKTKEVDMVHTRKHKELRLRIGCLDHTLIPETTEVFIERGFLKLAFDVEPVVVTQLGNDGGDENGGNGGGGDDNGSNEGNRDDTNDMNIEKTGFNENHNNGNKKNGNVQQMNGGKGGVGHQAHNQFKAPILLGSLTTDLLSTEEDSTGSLPHADSALGSVKKLAKSTSGSEQPVAAADCPLLGSLPPPGALPLAGGPAPGEASPRLQGPRSPLSPCRPQLAALQAAAASPLAGTTPPGGTGVAAGGHCGSTQNHAPVPSGLSPLTPTAAGPGTDGQSWCQDLDRGMFLQLGSSAATDSDNEGQTAFRYAVLCERQDITELLVKHQADLQIKDGDGSTPLHGTYAPQPGPS